MVNPQLRGVRSDTLVCARCLPQLERSVLVIFPTHYEGTFDGEILLKVGLRDNGIL